MNRKWIKRIIGGLSLTTAVFVFQACYGTPQDFGNDYLIEGQVKSKTSDLPIQGIKVSVAGNLQYELTDNDGRFRFYTEMHDEIKVMFQDIDSTLNGQYQNKDTVLTSIQQTGFLDIKLDDK